MNILYHMPTKVVMSDGCVSQNAALLKSMGARALIVTGANSAKICGALEDVTAALEKGAQSYAVYDKVMANPTVECVYDGAAFARKHNADFVVAIGGGSPMDAAKAIALLARQSIPKEKLYSFAYGDDVLPMAHIPTTAGTGSEVTPYAILTSDALKTKKSIASPALFPRFAFLDARYLKALPKTTLINTALDALTHAVEGMLNVRANALTDTLAGESIRRISSCFDAMAQGNLTHAQREQLLFASMTAGMVIANTATTSLHAMGYPLTYFQNIDHGRANGLLMAAFMDLMAKQTPRKTKYVLSLMGFDSVDAFSKVLGGLLGNKETLTLADAQKYSQIAILAKNIANMPAETNADDLLGVYMKSFGL